MTRLALLVFTALLGAGLTFGAMHAPWFQRASATQTVVEPHP